MTNERKSPVSDSEVLVSAARLRARAAELRKLDRVLLKVRGEGNAVMVETAALLERQAAVAEKTVRDRRRSGGA